MANSYVITTATPGQNTIPVPFAYIDQIHVHLEIDGVPLTAFIWNTSSLLGLVTPLVGGESIYLYRATPDEATVVTYAPGAITSANLNDQTQQLLYLLQEAKDSADASMGIDLGTGQYTALGLRIENLAAPVGAGDAVNKAYADIILLEGNALIEAGLAAVAVQVGVAAGWAGAAASSAGAANTDRLAVAADVVTVNQSLLDASAQALLASKYADNPEDSLVAADRFSAFHWSRKALASATAAAASAATAASNLIGAILGWTAQATPLDADQFGYVRASDSGGRRFTFANLKAFLLAYFNTVYARFDAAQALTQAQKGQHAANVGQAWEQIGARVDVDTAVASVSWSGLGIYRQLRIKGYATPTTDDVGLGVRLSTDNGATFISTATYDYEIISAISTTISASNTASDTALYMTGSTGNTANEGTHVDVEVEQFNKAVKTAFRTHCFSTATDGTLTIRIGSGREANAAAMNGLQLFFSAGDIAVGSYFVLEGQRG